MSITYQSLWQPRQCISQTTNRKWWMKMICFRSIYRRKRNTPKDMKVINRMLTLKMTQLSSNLKTIIHRLMLRTSKTYWKWNSLKWLAIKITLRRIFTKGFCRNLMPSIFFSCSSSNVRGKSKVERNFSLSKRNSLLACFKFSEMKLARRGWTMKGLQRVSQSQNLIQLITTWLTKLWESWDFSKTLHRELGWNCMAFQGTKSFHQIEL